MSHERLDYLASMINEYCANQVVYEESHIDAGDSYSHLPAEGGWCYTEGDRRLMEFLRVNNINVSMDDIEELGSLILEDFSMVSKHNLSSNTNSTVFIIDSYQVGELEIQIDYNTIDNLTKNRLKVLDDNNLIDAHIGSFDKDSALFYITSDVVWSAQISLSEILEVCTENSIQYTELGNS